MCKLEACHMAEVSSLQARCDRQVSELQRRIDELETEKANQDSLPSPQQPADKPATELEDKDEEEENQKDEQEGPVSISALAAGSFDAVEDVGELQARIHVLETQCSALQRKLNARPIVHANARTPRRPTVKRATGLLGVLREILEQLLRNFTERLLKRDAFLWVFYGHLCVLYVIAASCYAQTGVGSSTVDVDLHAKQALRGVVAWGSPVYGGNTSRVEDQLTSGVVRIYPAECAFAAVKRDGTLVTWGYPRYGGSCEAVRHQLVAEVLRASSECCTPR